MFGFDYGVRSSHMQPQTLHAHAVQSACLYCPIEQQIERKRTVWRIGKDARMKNGRTGIGKGRNLLFRAPGKPAIGFQVKIATAMITHGVGNPRQKQDDVHPSSSKLLAKRSRLGLIPSSQNESAFSR